MTDADRPVPGQTKIPFHIRVKRKHLTRIIKGKVERIAKTIADQGEIPTGRVDTGNPTTMSIHIVVMPIRILDQRQQVVDLPDRRSLIDIHLRDLRKISRYNI